MGHIRINEYVSFFIEVTGRIRKGLFSYFSSCKICNFKYINFIFINKGQVRGCFHFEQGCNITFNVNHTD